MSKVSKKNINTQHEALLFLIYQQELFDHVDEEDSGKSKEFREFITEEAKELLEKTIKWFEGKITVIPPEDQKSQLKMYIK